MGEWSTSMDIFKLTLQSWQFFFTAVATASATLTGLLFVSLSLNRERLRGEKAHLTLSIARNYFNAIYGLVGVIAALLVTACWNAWLLLVE